MKRRYVYLVYRRYLANDGKTTLALTLMNCYGSKKAAELAIRLTAYMEGYIIDREVLR